MKRKSVEEELGRLWGIMGLARSEVRGQTESQSDDLPTCMNSLILQQRRVTAMFNAHSE